MLQSRLLMNLRGIGISFIPRYFFQINLDKIFNDILKYNIKDLEEILTLQLMSIKIPIPCNIKF